MNTDQMTQRTHAVFEGQSLKRRAAYIARGRQFAGLSDADLRARWCRAFTAWSHDFMNDERRSAEEDLQSEILLRGQEPPYDQVADRLDAIVAASRELTAEWKSDPAARRAIGMLMLIDIEELEAEEALPN